jgi:cell division protein FtsZ
MEPKEDAVKYTWSVTGLDPGRSGCCHVVVIGVGGAGSNTVTRLMEAGIASAECVAVNTDAVHLQASKANHKILIGEKLTKGLGVGGNPRLGRAAIEESRKLIENLLANVDIVFITAGLGGGTGTGAVPVIAEIARRKGALTVGVITMPFKMEKSRTQLASKAMTEMRRQCDTVVVIDDNRLMQLVPQLPITEAFRVADQVLANVIRGIIETISTPSMINMNVADFKTVVHKGGLAVVGVGESDAPNRAEEAVRSALSTPLLDVGFAGAKGALIHVTGDDHMTLEEVNHVGEIVTQMMDCNAHVIWGARVNPQQVGKLKVTLVMTGVGRPHALSSLAKIAPHLYNMEPRAEQEKTLGIDLDLYQMENF